MEFVPGASCGSLSGKEKENLWATVLAVFMFEKKLSSEKDMWELVVSKARDWVSELVSAWDEDVKRLEILASEVLVA